MAFTHNRRPLAEEEKSTDAAKARARAMELLAGQELSSGILYERLNRRFTEQTSAAVVAEMVEREYVNDERYAEARARAAGGEKEPPCRRAESAAEGPEHPADRTGAGSGLRPGRRR